MALELHEVLNQLLMIDSRSSSTASAVEDVISKVYISFNAPDLLTAITDDRIDLVIYCRSIECLLVISSTDWLFPELAAQLRDDKSDTNFDGESLTSLIENTYRPCLNSVINKLYECAVVGNLSREEDALSDSPIEFHNIAIRACSVFRAFSVLLDSLFAIRCAANRSNMKQIRDAFNALLKQTSFKALLVSLEHQEQLPWTSCESMTEAKKLVGVTCHVNNCTSFEALLNGNNDQSTVPCVGYLQAILSEILPKLSKTQWKLNPSIPYVFCYCLHSVGRTHLGDNLLTLLPPSLVFFDDHQEANRLLGLRCLQHIISTCSRAELQWFGRADVIYDSLQRAFYGCDKTLLDPLIDCLLAALNTLEVSPCQVSGVRNVGHHDHFFVRYLSSMESENVISVRRIYSRHLPRCITIMGVTIVRHLRRVIQVLVDYLAINDCPEELCRFYCLDALYVLLQQAWPRLNGHADTVMKSLVRLIHDIPTEYSTSPSDVTDKLTRRALDCIHLLRLICPAYTELDDCFFTKVRQNEQILPQIRQV